MILQIDKSKKQFSKIRVSLSIWRFDLGESLGNTNHRSWNTRPESQHKNCGCRRRIDLCAFVSNTYPSILVQNFKVFIEIEKEKQTFYKILVSKFLGTVHMLKKNPPSAAIIIVSSFKLSILMRCTSCERCAIFFNWNYFFYLIEISNFLPHLHWFTRDTCPHCSYQNFSAADLTVTVDNFIITLISGV